MADFWLQIAKTELKNYSSCKKYSPFTGNCVCRIQRCCQTWPFLRMRSKNMVKNQVKRQIDEISLHLREIRVAENNGNNRFQTGSRNNVSCTNYKDAKKNGRNHWQNGYKCSPFNQIFDPHRKQGH